MQALKVSREMEWRLQAAFGTIDICSDSVQKASKGFGRKNMARKQTSLGGAYSKYKFEYFEISECLGGSDSLRNGKSVR